MPLHILISSLHEKKDQSAYPEKRDVGQHPLQALAQAKRCSPIAHHATTPCHTLPIHHCNPRTFCDAQALASLHTRLRFPNAPASRKFISAIYTKLIPTCCMIFYI